MDLFSQMQAFHDFTFEEFADELNNSSSSSSNLTFSDYVCPGLDPFSPEDTPGFSSFRKHFNVGVYLLVFILGTVGNGLLLVILKRYQHARTLTENYLLHLAVADLLLLLTFPFAVVEILAGWVFGEFLCKAIYTIHKVNFFCSSLLLGCISVDRYLAIVHAVHTYKKRKAMSIHLTCLAVWVLCHLLAVPYLFVLEVSTNSSSGGSSSRSSCVYSRMSYRNGWWHANRFLYHVVGFLVPLLIMCFCYAAIVRTLCQSQRFEKQKAVRVALIITGVFFLCWTPYNVVIFLDTLLELEALQSCNLNQHLPLAIVVTEVMGFLHCCLNPVLYAFVGVKFRNDLFRVLGELGCLSQRGMQSVLQLSRRSSGTDSENATSVSTF